MALVLEALPGETLDVKLHRGRLGLGEALRIAIAVTDAVAGVHGCGVVHKISSRTTSSTTPRRAAPASSTSASPPRWSTRAAGPEPGRTGERSLTSPEQTGRVAIAVDQRSDLYSLGVMFYELFTGAPAFATVDPMEMICCHLARRPIRRTSGRRKFRADLSACDGSFSPSSPKTAIRARTGCAPICRRACACWNAGAHQRPSIGAHDISMTCAYPQRLYGPR